jgi:hypothetical protein
LQHVVGEAGEVAVQTLVPRYQLIGECEARHKPSAYRTNTNGWVSK